MTKRVRLYGATLRGKQWIEVLDTRERTKLVSSVETGFTYRTWREMDEAIGQKNRALVLAELGFVTIPD